MKDHYAFPMQGYGQGMTLRDYFAAQALAGIRASETDMSVRKYAPAEAAAKAYKDADAMMEERSKAE